MTTIKTVQKYDVDILVPNYNNSDYLVECLQSIVNQKTQYNYFVTIIDDKSTDNSIDIITNFCDKYPNNFDLIQNEINSGTCETTLNLYKQINSKYFTVLDSDDYWIDNNFLERSITFLENNNEYTSYSNNQQMYYENTNEIKIMNPLTKKECGFDIKNDAFLNFCSSHTSGCMFRNIFSEKMISNMKIVVNNKNQNNNFINQLYCQIYEGDTFRNIISNTYGKSYEDNTIITSVYRIKQQNSRWASLNVLLQNMLNYFIYLEMYLKITHCNEAQKYLMENCVDDIYNKLFKNIIINNKINDTILYNKKIVTVNEINNTVLYIVNKYNLLPTKKYNKHFLFVLPSKIIGGYETLFVNLAVELQKNGYKVSYIDYENGHFNKLINNNNNNINLIKFPDNHPYQDTLLNADFVIKHEDDVNLIMPLTLSSEVIINLSKKSKILYYMAHPKSVEFLHYRSRVSMEKIVNHIKTISNNICCQDETNLINLQKITNNPHKIIPIFVKEPELTFTGKNNKDNHKINIGYLGRLDMDKIYSLINILDNFVLYETLLEKNIHIIGEYNSETFNLIHIDYYKNCGINIIFAGLLINDDKFNYLYNNIDIFFGLGTTVLEAASIKIPSVIILAQEHKKFNDDKFIWLHNLLNINNGFYEEDICGISKLMFNNFSQILDSIYYDISYKDNKIEEIGNKSYNYYLNNHTINNTLLKIIDYFIKPCED
jgi:glycosyltransferase involved in cell wall biosynthesis